MNPVDTLFVLICAAMVLLMTPALAVFYAAGTLVVNGQAVWSMVNSFLGAMMGMAVWRARFCFPCSPIPSWWAFLPAQALSSVPRACAR